MDPRLVWGTVELLILEVVSGGPSYGYQIAQRVLYPALHRLERRKLLSSFWQTVDGRERKYYRLTAAGQAQLAAKKQEWQAFARGVQGILGGADGLAP